MGQAGRNYGERGGRDKRSGGWGNDRDRGGDGYRRDDRPEYGQPARQDAAPEAVTGTLKFYDPNKGFGFVEIASKGQDAFLHATALPIGTEVIAEGSTLRCMVRPDPKKGGKLAVASVEEIDESTASQSRPAPKREQGTYQQRREPGSFQGRRPDGPTSTGKATLARMNFDKGYGFLRLEDGQDVFLHISVAEQAGIDVVEGDRYEVDYATGERGVKAVALRRA